MRELRQKLDAAPMSQAQIVAIAITFILSALDGYDVLSVAFAAPAITESWNIGRAALGVVLSAGLAGMALGSFFIAPLADTYGRKTMVLLALGLMGVGMLGSALSSNIGQLLAWRVFTGLGIGTCVSVINPIAAEFANAKRRPLTISIMAVGYPAGGVAGGLLAAYLLDAHGWQSVFLAGFIASMIMLPVVGLLLPESISFLLTRRSANSLVRANAVLQRFGHPPLSTLPPPPTTLRRGYSAVFARDQISTTLWLTAVNALFVMAVYFVLSWLPQMVADANFSPSTASLVSAISSLSGVVGGVTLGVAAQWIGMRWLAAGAIGGLGVGTIVFGTIDASFTQFAVTAAICGFFLFGGIAGIFASIAKAFADEARASGTGFVIGFGRIASALAPLLAGWLFAAGLGRAEVSAVFGLLAIIASAIMLFGWRLRASS